MMMMMMQIKNDDDDAVLKAPHFTYTISHYQYTTPRRERTTNHAHDNTIC